jgi:hypothetical protein
MNPVFTDVNSTCTALLCVLTLKVHENWKKCLQEIPRYESLEVDCKQVKRCIEIARRCMENDRHKRPTINDIVSQLDEIEMENCKLDSPLQLGEVPLLICCM